MIRRVIVSTTILCGLFAADAAAKNPNMPNIPKITVPRPPAAGRMLIVPRNIIAPLPDHAADADDNTKKKKKKKNVAGSLPKSSKGLAKSSNGLRVSTKGLPVSDKLRDTLLVFGGSASALAEIKEILEGLEDGDNGAFGGPLATLYPDHQTADPKPSMPGTGGHTTGQHEGNGDPGHRLEDIISRLANAGRSGDNRGPDEGQSGSDNPKEMFGSDRSGSVGGMGVGAFDGGLPDPSGQASQRGRGWASCGSGCTFRWTEVRRGGRVVAHRSERRDQAGKTTRTTNDRTGVTRTRFESRHWAYESYSSTSQTSPDNQQMIEVRDYDDPEMQDVIISSVVGPDGGWQESSRDPIPEVDQPAPDEGNSGGGPRGGAFYELVCGGMVCTYTPRSREDVVVSFGPIQINPGDMDNQGSGNVDSGPRVGPRAVTDPDPENLGIGSGGGQPIVRGCGGLIRC